MKKLYLEEIDSTNKYAKEHIEELSDRTVVYTHRQTAGRGRLNRVWNDLGEDNVYASIVLKPSSKMENVYSNLTQYLCVVLAETFENYGVVPKIKWPNDIKINGKKISGILAETVFEGNDLKGLVLGVGINLNSTLENLSKINQAATALNIETGKFIDKENFLHNLLIRFDYKYEKFIHDGFLLIRNDYKKRAIFLEKEISVKVFDKTITGFAKDVTEKGALKLINNNNEEQILFIGDILE